MFGRLAGRALSNQAGRQVQGGCGRTILATIGRFLAVWAVLAAGVMAAADVPLHVAIDDALPSAGAPRTSDAEFLRRVSLDLNGVPPTGEEVREFLADQSPDKRARAVDRLLSSLRYGRHMAEVFDVMLMERRPNTHISADEWHAYLHRSISENKPFNQLAREILSADGTDPNLRPAVRFYLDRASEPNAITRDIGRIFLGRDMQCAQCHNHPLIDDYLQVDYHGLFAYVAGGHELKIKEGDKEVVYYAEKAAGDVEFESVFVKGTKHLTGPKLFGATELAEPIFLPGDEYEVAPADNVRPKPKFSRRQALAAALTDGTNRAFNENIANRLWAHMMGRGLVHPADLHHSGNPPSHPELLRLLGERFAAMNFNVKEFLREIALSDVYQRSIDLPGELLTHSEQAAERIAKLQQQVEKAEGESTAARQKFHEAIDKWNAAEQALLPVVTELGGARKQYLEAKKKLDAANKELADARSKLAGKEAAASALTEAVAKANEAVAKLGDDAELKAAAQKFVDKLAAVQGELPALKEAVTAKEAAVVEPAKAVDVATGVVNAAQEKVNPLKQAMLDAERVVVEARRTMIERSTKAESLEATLETARVLASLKPAQETVTASLAAIPTREQELTAATAQVTDYAGVITDHQAALAKANADLAVRQKEHSAEREELQKRTERAASVQAAVTATENALARLGQDPALMEVVGKLQSRLAELNALTAEQQVKLDAASAAEQQASNTVTAATQALKAAQTELTRRQQAVTSAQKQLAEARLKADTDRKEVQRIEREISANWVDDFTVAPLKPLTPEQLCWSIFQVTGVYKNYWAKHEAELNKSAPLSEDAKNDPAQLAARGREIEERVYKELKGNVGTFVSLYGAEPGQPQTDFFATADQALFAANGGSILSWAAPNNDNPADRIVKAENPQQAAEALYLGVLSRLPSESEVQVVSDYLSQRPNDRPAAATELVWGLLTSAEFRFNH